MPQDFVITRRDPQPVMSIRGWTPVPDVARVIGERLTAVWGYVQGAGGAVTGPPFTRYHAVEGDRADLEAGLPVARPVPPRGEIRAGELPGGEAARAIHVGPYEGLPDTGRLLRAWAADQGRDLAGPSWEVYVTDPGLEADPARWKTELLQPLQPTTA